MHYLRYTLGLQKDESKKALRMGGAFHEGQELIASIPRDLEDDERQAKVDEAVLHAIRDYNESPPGGTSETEWAVEREVVGRLLQGWAWRYAKEPMEITHAEVFFKQPVKNIENGSHMVKPMVDGGMPVAVPLYRSGLIDKMVKLDDGRVGILEHKTTGDSIKPNSDYWIRAKMSGQVTYYYKAATDDPDLPNPDLVLYDVIRKPSIEPSKLTLAQHRNFLGLSYRKGKKTIVQPDPEQLHKYCGEEFQVEINGKIDLEEPENTVIESVAIDGYVASFVKSGNHHVLQETPTMYGARLMVDMLDRPDMYFSREEIPRLQGDLEELEADVHQTVEMITFCERTNQWPKNVNSCIAPWKCEFLPLCSSNVQVTIEGGPPQGYKFAEFIHPELEERVKGKSE